MQTVLSTAAIPSGDKFDQWCGRIRESFYPFDGARNGDGPFDACLEVGMIGTISVGRLTQDPAKYTLCPTLLRRNMHRDDHLLISFNTGGLGHTDQHGRESFQRPGDIVIREVKSLVMTTCERSREDHLSIPRHRIEGALGSARTYTSLTLEARQAATSLAVNFFADLRRVQDRLSPEAAARMTSIGIDLIVAGIAERLAREVPRSLHGTLVVQRAKAHIESNLGDPTLDPAQLAAAMGVSLRRLQELFQDQGRPIADWLWERRLVTAAERLADRRLAHLPIGDLAYGCGFASQSHFSRRFKERFGLTPREYREHAKV